MGYFVDKIRQAIACARTSYYFLVNHSNLSSAHKYNQPPSLSFRPRSETCATATNAQYETPMYELHVRHTLTIV
jgi:hypothetical protein